MNVKKPTLALIITIMCVFFYITINTFSSSATPPEKPTPVTPQAGINREQLQQHSMQQQDLPPCKPIETTKQSEEIVAEPEITTQQTKPLQPKTLAKSQGMVVLGMHRSGTSMITGLIAECLGVYVGPNKALAQPNMANQKGFYERNDLLAVDMQLLNKKPYLHPDPIMECEDMLSPHLFWTAGLFSKQGKYVMLREMNQHPLWIIKDPRLCITYDFWEDDITDPVFIIPVRHPAEVADSLWRRNRVPSHISLDAWYFHVMNAIKFSINRRRIFILTKDVISDPRGYITSLYSQLKELNVPVKNFTNEEITSCADTWVDPNLIGGGNKGEGDPDVEERSLDAPPKYQGLYNDVLSGRVQTWTYEDLPAPHNNPPLHCGDRLRYRENLIVEGEEGL